MTTQQELDAAGVDAVALTTFMTDAAGTTNPNSEGVDIGTLADWSLSDATATFSDVAELQADTATRLVGDRLACLKECALFEVVDGTVPAHIVTAGGSRLVHPDGPYVIAISGQSNAAGSNDDGPNPASSMVKIWDGNDGVWGSSDRTLTPLSRLAPHGNNGNNNYALARAHRVTKDTGRPVFIIFDAVGGTALSDWIDTGITSVRYAALTQKIADCFATPELSTYGVSEVNEVIFAQGEADYQDDFATYLAKIDTFRLQLRAETWCLNDTPIYMMSPSDLHDRYQWRDALVHLCSKVDGRCIFVPGNGLRTEFSLTGAGDWTHFNGESLWEAGYTRIAEATNAESTPTCFYGRGTGPVDATDATAMTTFRTLVSRDSWTSEVAPNGPAATGSISWGHQCAADGNYTFAMGYDCATDNLSNYGIVSGRQLLADANADFYAGFGYQNTLSARYTLCSGRGHVLADEGGSAFGMFSEYATSETDHVLFQVGIGASGSTRSNGLTVRKSGQVEMKHLPIHAGNASATAAGLVVGTLYATSGGDIKVVI